MKKIIISSARLLVCSFALLFCLAACDDYIPAESYYTFTGEMMSDYLQSRPQFSEFCKIIERTPYSQRGTSIMDLLGTYGLYTCFAPTNEAVADYLAQNGYASVDDIPYDLCDTIARTHLVNGRRYETIDMQGASSLPTVNMNKRYLQLTEAYAYVEGGDTIYTVDSLDIVGKTNVHATFRVNRSGYVHLTQCNDSVENGTVHTVNAVLSSSNQTVCDLMVENEEIGLFTMAMQLVGISEYIQSHVKDDTWDPDLWDDKSIYTGNQWDWCFVPETKNYGFTVFVCPDDVLAQKYSITNMQEFYDYARSVYGGDQLDVYDEANAEALTHWRSPLRRLIGYNILKSKGMYDDLTSICTIETTLVNPVSWYPTLDSLTTIKIDRLTVNRFIGYGEHDEKGALYLNRGDMSRGFTDLPGTRVYSDLDDKYTNEGVNGVYYLTDGLADYGSTTQDKVFNTRIRFDTYYLFPELMTNSIRDGRTNNYNAYSNVADKTLSSPNYWFPPGYLDNVTINADAEFFFQSQHNAYSCFEGDEFNLASAVNNYDITFNLMNVPSGTYQIRIGFCALASRGICQFYLDGEPQGTPFDMRDTNMEERTGWFNLIDNNMTADEAETAKKNMHNNGWYHGPRSVFKFSAEGNEDGANASKTYFCTYMQTSRYVIATINLDNNYQHTVRIKSIWAPNEAEVILDYFELVPKSVYGIEGDDKAEDDY